MKIGEDLFSLQGKEVTLIPISLEHLDGLWEAAKPDDIWTYMAAKVRTKPEMEEMIKTAIKERERGTQYTFTVLNSQDEIVGSTRFLDISPFHKSAEIGSTWYHPKVWRTRVNTECKYLLLTHAFEEWGLTRVQLKTDFRNVRSQNAIARLGAIREGVLRKDRVISDGYVRDTVYFSILSEEWEKVKCQLMKKLHQA
jgi:RimJ/RimL family protein N-acetyltransferase